LADWGKGKGTRKHYRNRLTEVDHSAAYGEQSDQIVQYRYDYANRLISRMLDGDGASGTADVEKTAYVYDGSQIALQFNKTSATGSASALSASDLSHRYLWGPAVDQLLADEHVSDLQTPGDVVWPLADHLGTVRDLATYDSGTDTTTIANHRVYDSYGNMKSETSAAVDCLFGFTGRQFDKQTGLQNNLNRWYDVKVGRWASKDPISYIAGDANLYRYIGNSPTNAIDPTGLAHGFGYGTGFYIKTSNGIEYSGRYSWELLNSFNNIQNAGQKISYMMIKGHGSEDNMFDRNNYAFIEFKSTQGCPTTDDEGYISNRVGSLLKGITDKNTKIALRGCNTGILAGKLSGYLHNGTSVTGTLYYVVGIPGTSWYIGPWWTF
jgi:RHS repeat-associated protein